MKKGKVKVTKTLTINCKPVQRFEKKYQMEIKKCLKSFLNFSRFALYYNFWRKKKMFGFLNNLFFEHMPRDTFHNSPIYNKR